MLAQQQRIIAYNLVDKTVDTLASVSFDVAIPREVTPYFSGKYANTVAVMPQTPPMVNVVAGTQYSIKKKASSEFTINQYPVSSSVKLYRYQNNSLKQRCSGSFISNKHVLTAAHCVAAMNENTLLYDSLFVCPALDEGIPNANFECGWVKKVFIFKDWSVYQTDIAVLELEEPIGTQTGWLSIGFDVDNELLLDGVFHKFSYPDRNAFDPGPHLYNGDTLWYSYGKATMVNEHRLGVFGAEGIPGESGSSFIKIQNGSAYTSYGVLSSSAHLTHCKFNPEKYYNIKAIIQHAFTTNEDTSKVDIYPNPVATSLYIEYTGASELQKVMLFNISGSKVLVKQHPTTAMQLNLSTLPNGTYILMVVTATEQLVKKVMIAH